MLLQQRVFMRAHLGSGYLASIQKQRQDAGVGSHLEGTNLFTNCKQQNLLNLTIKRYLLCTVSSASDRAEPASDRAELLPPQRWNKHIQGSWRLQQKNSTRQKNEQSGKAPTLLLICALCLSGWR